MSSEARIGEVEPKGSAWCYACVRDAEIYIVGVDDEQRFACPWHVASLIAYVLKPEVAQ